jgi:hypothetical protein
MSLKALHIVFITAACLLAFGFSVWCFTVWYSANGATRDLVFGAGSLVVGVALIVYGRYFLKKLKDVGYL